MKKKSIRSDSQPANCISENLRQKFCSGFLFQANCSFQYTKIP